MKVASVPPRPAIRAVLVAGAALAALHVALTLHFTPRGLLSLPAPLLTSAFAVDAYRADRALAALRAAGRLSIYDPRVLAGGVAGLGEPLGTRAVVLATVMLARRGVDPVRAFNALVVALHLVIPVVGYVGARAFGAARAVALGVFAMWSALTFVDALTHYAWFSGRIEFVAASALVVVEAALADRALRQGGFVPSLGVFVVGALAALAHPLPALFAMAIVLVGTATAGTAHPSYRLAVASAAVASVAWLPLLARGGSVTSEPLATVFHVGPSSVFWDLVEIPGPGYGAAGSSRTLLRVLCLGAAALSFVQRRRPFGVVGLLAVGATLAAYFGSLLPIAWPVDPYFFAIVAAFAASLPAVELAFAVPWAALARRGSAFVRVGLLLAAAVAVPRLVRTVLTYAPELLPERIVRGPSDLAVSALGGIDEPFPDPLGYDPPSPSLPVLVAYLVAHGAARGRVLTDDAAVAGFLALRTPLEVLGPLGERGGAASSADPSRLLEGAHDTREIGSYLERYAVGFVVLAGARGPFDADSRLFDAVVPLDGYRVRRVVREPSFVARGVARVDGTSLGVIRVRGASGPRVTLRYHFDAALVCRPGCVVEREPVSGDAAGFLTVPEPPAAFDIYER